MREVKAQAVGGHKRAGLAHVVAKDLLKGGVEQVRRGVVAADELAAAVVNHGGHAIAHRDGTIGDLGHMAHEAALMVQGVGDARRTHDAGVAHLAAHLAVERRAIEHELNLVARRRLLNRLAVAHDGHNLAARELVVVIAVELSRGKAVGEGNPDVVGLAPGVAVGRGAGALALGLHGGIEGVHVNGVAGRASNLARKVDGEAVGVVQGEGDLA